MLDFIHYLVAILDNDLFNDWQSGKVWGTILWNVTALLLRKHKFASRFSTSCILCIFVQSIYLKSLLTALITSGGLVRPKQLQTSIVNHGLLIRIYNLNWLVSASTLRKATCICSSVY